ncbi:MAG: hypothetical protein U5J96_19705 [Ignavibacteriaceae bacterium]|nr:hypothetical protein [Ignavibacteriaceae bacterium]
MSRETTDGGTTWVASNLTSLKSFFSIASLKCRHCLDRSKQAQTAPFIIQPMEV